MDLSSHCMPFFRLVRLLMAQMVWLTVQFSMEFNMISVRFWSIMETSESLKIELHRILSLFFLSSFRCWHWWWGTYPEATLQSIRYLNALTGLVFIPTATTSNCFSLWYFKSFRVCQTILMTQLTSGFWKKIFPLHIDSKLLNLYYKTLGRKTSTLIHLFVIPSLVVRNHVF